MGQIISFIKKRLLGVFLYCFKNCFCRQRKEKKDYNEHHSIHISNPELLDPLSYSCFKLRQNVSTTSFDPVEENRQDSAHVLNVDNLEERDVRDQEGWIHRCCSSHKMLLSEAFGSDPLSDCETDSRIRLHQNVSTTCFDPVEDNRQGSEYALDMDNLEERDDTERWIRHYRSSHKMMLVGDGDFSLSASLAGAFDSDPSNDSLADSSFRLHQSVSTTCFDVVEKNRQNHSASVLNVDNLEQRHVRRRRERWIRHYCSSHKILLVGEGDFSFSASLARAFGSATNMVATSLDSREILRRKYSGAMANLKELEELGCTISDAVDCRNMRQHRLLKFNFFDRIVYNFPHAGFFSCPEDRPSVIKRHKKVVKGFLRNAVEMLAENGQVHVTHKTAHPFDRWEIEKLANDVGLRLFKKVPFSISDYPGYQNKRGDGNRSNESFPLGECSTFKFKKRLGI